MPDVGTCRPHRAPNRLAALGALLSAATDAAMDVLGNGAITVFNGLLGMVTMAFSPMVIVGVILASSFVWLALIELDELDRQGSKPEIGRGL
jgi:hypothetical protein